VHYISYNATKPQQHFATTMDYVLMCNLELSAL